MVVYVVQDRVKEVDLGVDDGLEFCFFCGGFDGFVEADGLEVACMGAVGLEGFGAHAPGYSVGGAADVGGFPGGCGGDVDDGEVFEEVVAAAADGDEDGYGDGVGLEAAEAVAELGPGGAACGVLVEAGPGAGVVGEGG